MCLYIYKQQKHPSALYKFDQIVEVVKGKQIVMFLDYDGTLSPIVQDPEKAIMSESVSEFSLSLEEFSLRGIFYLSSKENIY